MILSRDDFDKHIELTADLDALVDAGHTSQTSGSGELEKNDVRSG
jgi:hypothetical protein